MKILHYIPSIDETSGGVGAYMQLLTRDLGKLCDLHVLTHKGDNERVLENCTVHYIPYKWNPWNNCKREFLDLLNELHPDVVHVNCCWQPVPARIAVWAKAVGYKVVYTPHGMLEPYAIKRHYWTKKLPAIFMFQKKGIQAADLIHATADSEKKNLIALGWNKNVTSIANCVQIDEIQMKTSWERKKNILFLSRVHVKKGINFLIEAMGKLKAENPELIEGYTITIAGPGEDKYFDELIELCKKNNLKVESFHNNTLTSRSAVTDACQSKNLSTLISNEPIVRFIGPVYAESKWPLYRKADLFVLPTWSENFGIVVPEALASGTPVITTVGTPWEELNGVPNENQNENETPLKGSRTDRPDGSINHKPYIINPQQCGWWTEIGTEPTIKVLRKFLSCSEEDLEQMGRNGRKLVEDKYTSEAIAKQFVDMYESLVNC